MTSIDISGALEARMADGRVMELQIAGTMVWKEPPVTVYFEDFESMPSGAPTGWTATGITHTVNTTSVINGLQSMNIAASASGRRWSSHVVSGLVIGQQYRLSALTRPPASMQVDVGVTGIGNGAPIAGDGTTIQNPFYEFTATATSHTIELAVTRLSGTVVQGRWDDILLQTA